MNNYFDLANPESLYCKVKWYQKSLLMITVSESEKLLCSLLFTPTYFQCPMEWKGANFQLANSEEHLALRKILAVDMSDEDFLYYLRLFILQADTGASHPMTIRILCGRYVEKYPAKV